MSETATHEVMRRLPEGWVPSVPLAFLGLRGRYIARLAGETPYPGAHQFPKHGHIRPRWELEGYGDTEADAIADLVVKLDTGKEPG